MRATLSPPSASRLRARVTEPLHPTSGQRGMGLTAAPGTAEEFTRDIDHQRDRVQEMARSIGLTKE